MTCISGQLTVQLCVQETTHKGPGQYSTCDVSHAIFSRWPILFASLLRNPRPLKRRKNSLCKLHTFEETPDLSRRKNSIYSDLLSLWSIHFQMWRNPLPRLWPINVSSRTNGRWPILFVSLFSENGALATKWPLMHVTYGMCVTASRWNTRALCT